MHGLQENVSLFFDLQTTCSGAQEMNRSSPKPGCSNGSNVGVLGSWCCLQAAWQWGEQDTQCVGARQAGGARQRKLHKG